MRNRLLAAALAATAWLAGCAVAPYDSYPVYGDPVYVEPPPPRVEYPGYAPVVGYLWIGGYWTWTGRRHEWMPGRWEAPRPGYRWVEPRWQRDGQQWRQMRGGWQPEGRLPVPGKTPPAPLPRNERIDGPRGPVPGVNPQPAAPQPAPGYRRDIDSHPLPGTPDMGNRPPPAGRPATPFQAPMQTQMPPPGQRDSRPPAQPQEPQMRRPAPPQPPAQREARPAGPAPQAQPQAQPQAPREATRGERSRGERRDDRNSGAHGQGSDR